MLSKRSCRGDPSAGQAAKEASEQASAAVAGHLSPECWGFSARSPDTAQWNEEVWRCLSGVLKGNSETLMDTLGMGDGLELWRQLCAAHVLKTPEHADKLHQALNRIEPAKTLAEVRHKINTIMAGVLKHDSMTDEPMIIWLE